MTSAEQFIESEIPHSIRLHFPRVLKTAYDVVKEIQKEHRWLRTQTVVDGHLRAWAADFGFAQLIESGKWPARKVQWAKYPKRTGKYLRIHTENAIVTVSQLAEHWKQPRKAVFRANARFNNQPFLFPDEEPEPTADTPHLIIGHGYQTLTFAQVAMPHPEHRRAWLAKTRNIFSELHDASSDLVPVEEVAVDNGVQIKSELLKTLSENAR